MTESGKKKGRLFVVATPIGHLQDMTLRAIETLKVVDCIAAEDTRHSKSLLTHFGISTPLISFHEHNENQRAALLIKRLSAGQDIALISDAGTPLISDPGYHLVTRVSQNGFTVQPIPGVCAAIAALSASGLPSDRFVFEGFLPHKGAKRVKRLQVLAQETRTLILYESVHRMENLLALMVEVLGADRQVVVARELTKQFENIHRGSAAELKDFFQQNQQQIKGEFVVLAQGVSAEVTLEQAEVTRLLEVLLEDLPPAQAASLCAKYSGYKKSDLYPLALQIKQKS